MKVEINISYWKKVFKHNYIDFQKIYFFVMSENEMCFFLSKKNYLILIKICSMAGIKTLLFSDHIYVGLNN